MPYIYKPPARKFIKKRRKEVVRTYVNTLSDERLHHKAAMEWVHYAELTYWQKGMALPPHLQYHPKNRFADKNTKSTKRNSANHQPRHIFLTAYTIALEELVVKNPEKYKYSVGECESVAMKMVAALAMNKGDKSGPAVKKTLKILGIKNTYTAIFQYLNQIVLTRT